MTASHCPLGLLWVPWRLRKVKQLISLAPPVKPCCYEWFIRKHQDLIYGHKLGILQEGCPTKRKHSPPRKVKCIWQIRSAQQSQGAEKTPPHIKHGTVCLMVPSYGTSENPAGVLSPSPTLWPRANRLMSSSFLSQHRWPHMTAARTKGKIHMKALCGRKGAGQLSIVINELII